MYPIYIISFHTYYVLYKAMHSYVLYTPIHIYTILYYILEIVITRAAPAFHKLFMVMGCVFDINTVHKTII